MIYACEFKLSETLIPASRLGARKKHANRLPSRVLFPAELTLEWFHNSMERAVVSSKVMFPSECRACLYACEMTVMSPKYGRTTD